MRLLVRPFYAGNDAGEGGIRRIVEAQEQYLPSYGIEVVRNLAEADMVAMHAGESLRTDLPYVEHCHGLYWAEYNWGGTWHYALNDAVIQSMLRADRVTAPSNWVANIIRRGTWIDPVVLYHGITLADWPLLSNEQQRQRQQYILWNKTRVDAICDPEPVNVLAARNHDLQFVTTFGNVAQNVLVTGRLPYETARIGIQQAALYLCTTRETFGIGTLEAMACNVPIVGWAWGGQREIIVNGENGWLATPGDYEELEHGIRYCLTHRDRLGAAARALVESKFDWQVIMRDYAELYYKVNDKVRERSTIKVSVIITNYKLEHYLIEAVKSVLAQENFPADQLEVVVVNDASPTWSSAIVNELLALQDTGANIVIINNETNQYLAGALNVGIRASSGQYIITLDADNLLAPRALATLAIALDNDRSIDIAYGAMEVFESASFVGVSGWPREFDYNQQMMHRNQIPSTAMYRREVWQRSGGYRERCATAEDADFWCRTTMLGFRPRKVTDAVVLRYRDRSDSMSHEQRDWGWHNWYSYAKHSFAAPVASARDIKVPTYEPTKVTVVIPVGPGHERYVVDAVDSLVNQSWLNWECIVVNDTGTALPWLHPFVRIIDADDAAATVTNRVSNARNIGIRASTTEYFVLLDADDYLQPSALKTMFDALSKEQHDVGYAYTDWYVAETKELHTTPNYRCNVIMQGLRHAVTCIYRREAFDKVGGFDPNLDSWEDWDFIIALNAAGYCGVRIPYPLLQYRVRAGHQREAIYAKLEAAKAVIRNKWSDYIDGVKTMPCGCSNSRGTTAARNRAAAATTSAATSNNEMVLLEYTGPSIGPLVYVGKATKTRYTFGKAKEHSIKYVYRSDAVYLLEILGFHYYEEQINEPVLEATGAPVRELANA